jgi:hypothetical protein
MPEKLRTRERIIKAASISLIGGAALSGCDSYSLDSLAELTPLERFSFDYLAGLDVSDFGYNFTGSQCLRDTAFNINNLQTTALFDADADTLTITSQNGDKLAFTDFDQLDHTLVPADEISLQIFETYDCEVEPYKG